MNATCTEEWLQVEGFGLRVQSHVPPGAGPAAPLVLLHEGLGCIEFWRDLPAALAAATGRRTVVYDRRGYGRSSPCPDPRDIRYLHHEAHVHLPALLDRLAIDQAVLIGHSDGGSIALLCAARFPERCAAIVTEAAHIYVDETTLEGIRRAVGAYESGNLRQALVPYHGERTEAVFRSWSDTWLAPWFRAWSIEAEIRAVRCPVLALQGAADPYGERAQVDGIVNAVGGPAWPLILPDCGHTPHNASPRAWMAAVTTFIAGLPRSPDPEP
jgi:pimeloyl-ACP methyl ester carboxylesterase